MPAQYAIIPNPILLSLPHYGTAGCAKIGVTPTDANMNIKPPGAGTSEPFNTLPSTLPAYN